MKNNPCSALVATLCLACLVGSGCNKKDETPSISNRSISTTVQAVSSEPEPVPSEVSDAETNVQPTVSLRGTPAAKYQSSIALRFGAASYRMESDADIQSAIVTGNTARGEFRYTLNVYAYPYREYTHSNLHLQFSSKNQNLNALTAGSYNKDFMEMLENDLYWTILFSPKPDATFELETGNLVVQRVQPNRAGNSLLLEGNFEGMAFPIASGGKRRQGTPLSGEFKIHIQNERLSAVL